MKRFDRYILSVFLPAFGLYASGLILLAMLVDILMRADELGSILTVPFALRYYAYRLPIYARTVLPVVPLLAAAFTVTRLARSREIVPMVTAGANLRRLCASFVFFGALAGGLVAAIEQWALPPIAEDLAEMDAYVRKKKSSSILECDARGNYVYAAEYDYGLRRMRGDVQLLQCSEAGDVTRKIRCRLAEWSDDDDGWVFKDGELWNFEGGRAAVQDPNPDRRPVADSLPLPPQGVVVKTEIRPERIRRVAETADRYGTFRSVREGVEAHPDVPLYAARLFDRITYPMSALLLLLLGLPSVLGIESKTHVKGTALCLVVTLVYFTAYLVGQDFTVQGIVPALYGCWGPTAIFGCLGGIFYGMIRT